MALREVLRQLGTRGTPPRALPKACYTDDEYWQAERERVLRPGWHAVARSDELPSPGDYRSLELFGEPVVLVRDEQLRLRVVSRICLHRAFPFVEGEGNTKRFQCPYHLWSYDLEGELRGAPLMDDVPGFEREACRLPELPVEEWQGFVLTNLDREAEPLAPRVRALDERLDAIGFAELRHVGTLEYDSPWNWKVMVENFMESYHHPGPHGEHLGKSHPARGTHAEPVKGDCTVLENPGVEGNPPFWVFQVFPTLLFFLQRGELPVGVWYEMQIDRADHLLLRIHLMLPPDMAGNEAVADLALDTVRKVHHEDIVVCEGVQRGLASSLWEPGVLSKQEACLASFHRYLAERMGA